MKNRFSTVNCRKSCQRPTEIFLLSTYPCTTVTVELELDVSVCAQLKIVTHKNSFTWLNFTKTLYFGPNNLSQITSNRRYVDPERKSLGATFKSKSSFVLLIGSLVICMKIQTNGLDATPGLPRGNVRICLCSHPDSVDD